MLEEGQAAPEFEVTDHNGNTIRLSDYRGENLLLWFYPKANTPGWTREGCGFRDNSQQFADNNTKIIGVSFDTEAKNRAFAEKYEFKFPLLCDTNRDIGMNYGACDNRDARTPKRISYLIGPDGTIRKAYSKVDARRHPEAVLNDLWVARKVTTLLM